MSTAALRVRAQRYFISAVLFAYSLWVLWRQPGSAAMATVSIIAGIGVVRNLRWSRIVVYIFSAILAGDWFWVLYRESVSGFLGRYLGPMPALKIVLVFLPGAIMLMFLAYCCYVAHRYVGVSAHI